ncbi:MAG: chromosome segregation SMC family protein [Actinomycetota bacterium]
MYVRSLRIAGFKSFADPTVLDFDRGVNVIVGPNGSGKSNIADALSWVLGSQAPSALRGGSMEDVIFAGSNGRPRLSFAEVEVTLDNTSGILGLDLAEVTLSRTTDRAGASEYRINGAACRLLDITELLSDAGIGRSIHTVVGQGQLDAVLQARPEDRRAFIEEAAQIGKYRRRKDRALRKIERVDDNLVRLQDVLGELRRALRPLKRQARAAAAYSELMGEHLNLRQRLAATELHRLAAEEARVDPEADARRAELLSEELGTVRARLEVAGPERARLAIEGEQTQDRAYRMRRAADRLTALERLAAERGARIAARLAAETEEGYRERVRFLEAERARWAGETARLQAGAGEARARATEASAAYERATAARVFAEQNLASARIAETDSAQMFVRAEGREAAARANVASIESHLAALAERRDVALRELQKIAQAMVTAERDARTLEGELDKAIEAAAEAEAALEGRRLVAEELRARVSSLHADRAAAEARVGAFTEVAVLLENHPQLQERLRALLDDARARYEVAARAEGDAEHESANADEEQERRWREVARCDTELRRLDALVAGASERLAAERRTHEAREIELATLDDELSHSQRDLGGAQTAAAEERAAVPQARALHDEASRRLGEAEEQLVAARKEEQNTSRAAAAAEIDARTSEERLLAARLREEEAVAGIADSERALAGLEELRQRLTAARERAVKIGNIARLTVGYAEAWAERASHRAAKARETGLALEETLGHLRARERELAQGLDEITGRRSRAEVRRAEIRARTEAIAERVMEEWGLAPQELSALEIFSDEAELAARERAERLERELKRLGPVNPHASQEFSDLEQREKFLEEQMNDLRSSRRDLMKIVREVDETIVQVFAQAFEDVAREFEAVFQTLFPGGSGHLKLTDPDDLLQAGIEVEARPPGKNVRKLSLLSGGERALVALAFLFAIFRSRPSPFYLLDEVEAALDDVNLHRFLGLVQDLNKEAQVLVVTHQKRTMEIADVLYGVSISKEGVSRVVAKRMEEIAV